MTVAIRSVCAALALAVASTVALAQKTQLLVYTALETDQLKAYEQGFYKEVSDVEIRWVRDSTGVITAKLLAEKANPQADVIMGVAASSLALLDLEGRGEDRWRHPHPLETRPRRRAGRGGLNPLLPSRGEGGSLQEINARSLPSMEGRRGVAGRSLDPGPLPPRLRRC